MLGLSVCRKCVRIVKNFDKLNRTHPDYQNKPIIPISQKNASISIVGLAPGLSGANRTGMIFKGDFSGHILNKTLELSGFNRKNNQDYPYITNAVKCFPPNNKPTSSEITNCNMYLKYELEKLINLRVIIALGLIAHNSILKTYMLRQKDYRFGHGIIHKINKDVVLIDSYHCSKINIYTKRLTVAMLLDIIKLAKLYI